MECRRFFLIGDKCYKDSVSFFSLTLSFTILYQWNNEWIHSLFHLWVFSIIVKTQVQVDRGQTLDSFSELPVSLVLFFLIWVDIIERIRPCKLMGKCKAWILPNLLWLLNIFASHFIFCGSGYLTESIDLLRLFVTLYFIGLLFH